MSKSALDVQVGGNHYKDMVIQPAVFCEANKLSHLESNIIKRACRWRKKDGLKDLEKIKHEVDLLIALNYGGSQLALFDVNGLPTLEAAGEKTSG